MEKLNLIALLGKSKVGKDTGGQMLCEMGNGQSMAFADKLKQVCMELFDLSREDCYTEEGKERPTDFPCLMCPTCGGLSCKVIKQDRDVLGECLSCGTVGAEKVFASKWTPRKILQYIGTEGFRRVDPHVWPRFCVNSARQRFEKFRKLEFVVITDCRFLSECEAVWAVGGEVWRIRRPEVEKKETGIKGHASEVEQDAIPDGRCQAVIHNDSTLKAYQAKLYAEFERFRRGRTHAEKTHNAVEAGR